MQTAQSLDIPLETDNNEELMQLLLDSTAVIPKNYAETNRADYNRLERQSRRLCPALHIERYKKLPSTVTNRKGSDRKEGRSTTSRNM